MVFLKGPGSDICRGTQNLKLRHCMWYANHNNNNKFGGLGIRSAVDLAPSSFLAAFHASQDLQARILQVQSIAASSYYNTALDCWKSLSQTTPPLSPMVYKQSHWDKPVVEAKFQQLLTNSTERARLLAVAAPHSGDWLHALPLSSCGLRLDNESIRVAVGYRVGANLCQIHSCPCGTLVNSKGSHVLSCKKSHTRILRHNSLNEVVFRALVRAGVPSIKEPSGLLRSDGKRPDGATQIPWASGKCLTWDVTVTDTLAPSYAALSSVSAGSAAESAAKRKESKYAAIMQTFDFVPLAFETMGPINDTARAFLSQLGKRLTLTSGDIRETAFLFQRISITVQRFQNLALLDSFVNLGDDSDD